MVRGRKLAELQVRVAFESDRLVPAAMERAYAHIVPIVRHPLTTQPTGNMVVHEEARERREVGR